LEERVKKVVDSLSDQVWFTRKARIRASERIASNHFHSDLLLIWYSFITFSLSIYLIKDATFLGANADVLMTIATGTVFTLSLLVPQLDFKNRSEKIKESYIKLQDVLFKLKLCESEDDVVLLHDKYMALLDAVENHKNIDLLYFIRFEAGGGCNRKLACKEVINIYIYLTLRTVFLTLLYTLPIYVIFI